MKNRTIVLAMMALVLSVGPLMAMDSEYLEKRRQALQETRTNPAIQAENPIEKRRNKEVSHRVESQHSLIDEDSQNGKLTREALRYWWH